MKRRKPKKVKAKKNLFASAAAGYEKPKPAEASAFVKASNAFKRINRRGFVFHRGGQFTKPKEATQ